MALYGSSSSSCSTPLEGTGGFSSHFFLLRLRALRRPSRLPALLCALAGAPFCALSSISSGQWPPGHIYIVNCTIFCTKYSRPVLAMNRSDDLVFFVIVAKCPHVFDPPFDDPFGSSVSDLNFSFIYVQYNSIE